MAQNKTPMIAPTGKGKSCGVVAPSLLKWPGKIILIDTKGELAVRRTDLNRPSEE